MKETFKMNANGAMCLNYLQSAILIIFGNHASKNGCDKYSQLIARHKELWLTYDWDDIKYIIIPQEEEKDKIIDIIMHLENAEERDKIKLISKIEIAERVFLDEEKMEATENITVTPQNVDKNCCKANMLSLPSPKDLFVLRYLGLK